MIPGATSGKVNPMAKRMSLMLIVFLTFVTVLGFVKYRQIEAAIAQASSYQPPPEAVTTAIAREESWSSGLASIATVQAVNGVTVSADLPGIVEKISFDSGRQVREGDVLVVLDAKQERAQLAAAEARRDLAKLSLDRVAGLLRKGVASRAEYDAAVAEHDQAEAIVGEIRATIERKTIRAPFSGILGIRAVDRGEYLMSGQAIVPLQSLDPVYVNFDVPQQEVADVPIGARVRISAQELAGFVHEGRISAIDSVVDRSTRNFQVQATFANPEGRLRPGMFVNAEVILQHAEKVIPIPASSIQYAPFGDSVYVVDATDGPGGPGRVARQQFVKLGASRGDLVAVISGIQPGEEIVTSGTFKLRNGAAVVVNNEIQPGSNPAPSPENS
jgi:membrane fusion protein (multidrug efflux system)